MTINGAITQLVMMVENSMMPNIFRPALDKVIETISELEPEPHWIPCSERLPEEGVDVLFMFLKNTAVGSFEDGVLYINSGGGWYTICVEGDDQPIAWMPLPEPYKREGEKE